MSKITLGILILCSMQIQFDEVIIDPLIATLVQAIIVGLHLFRAFRHVFYWPINICIDLKKVNPYVNKKLALHFYKTHTSIKTVLVREALVLYSKILLTIVLLTIKFLF